METKKAIEIIQEKIAVNVITDYVKKAGFDPAQERDENGMWTDGDSGGFDAVKKDALKKLNKIKSDGWGKIIIKSKERLYSIMSLDGNNYRITSHYLNQYHGFHSEGFRGIEGEGGRRVIRRLNNKDFDFAYNYINKIKY